MFRFIFSVLGIGRHRERVEPRLGPRPRLGLGPTPRSAPADRRPAPGPDPGPGQDTVLPRVPAHPSANAETTVLPLPAPPASAEAYTLELIGLALPRLDRPGMAGDVLRWSVAVTEDGGLAAEDAASAVVLLGASRSDPRLWVRAPRGGKWRDVRARGAAAVLAALPAAVRLAPAPLPEHYHALLVFDHPQTVAVRGSGRRIFGRSGGGGGGENTVSFPPTAPKSVVLAAGGSVGLDAFLSRRHLELSIRHGQLHVRPLAGGAPVWKLDGSLRVLDRVAAQAAGRDLVLADHQMFLAGSHVVRVRRG